ncbi:MAG: radical SAM protein [Candidatus Methanoperedens sp.]|nr:radical SAM protein [Candidatus Methanoperedens sp.]
MEILTKMEKDSSGSFFNYLPQGCRLCYMGAKMVLFVTGLCRKNCFYCPVSNVRQGKDLIFANERPVKRDEDIIEEAVSMDALGTGITGGEPLLRLRRVIHYIKLLKNQFGGSHHIHLYTALAPGKAVLESLREAGLDELRFHPPHNLWADKTPYTTPYLNTGNKGANITPYRKSLLTAHELGLSTGIEIPSIASDFSGILSLLDEVGGFLNLNELEFSETNSDRLKKRGFAAVDDVSSAALGSKEVAESLTGSRLHFCSSRFKDAVQLRERFKRIAKKVSRDFDEITDDGTLVYGVIEGDCLDILKETAEDDMYCVRDGSTETGWWIAEELAAELKKAGCIVSVIERYPMKNGMVVEKTPL